MKTIKQCSGLWYFKGNLIDEYETLKQMSYKFHNNFNKYPFCLFALDKNVFFFFQREHEP
jgi:hypothetical protein